jgi:hypothetical protein
MYGYGYGLRRRRAAVAGSAPPWRPNREDIPGLLCWFDPTDATKISTGPIGEIDLVIPQIGDPALYTMSQPAQINRPYSINGPNGKTLVGFDGNHWLRKDGAPIDLTAGISMVLVWYDTAPGISQGYVSLHSAECRLYLLSYASTPAQLQYRYGEAPEQGFAYRPIEGNRWNISTTRGREHWLNGGDRQDLPGGTYFTNAAQQINYGMVVSSPPMRGALGHWLVIEGPVSEDMLRRIEGFAAWDLGFPEILVPGHPWRDQQP